MRGRPAPRSRYSWRRGRLPAKGRAAAARLHRRTPHGRSRSPPIPPSFAAATTIRQASRRPTAARCTSRHGINYESVGARSAFVGWTFSGGDELKWELTPLLGGAWGTTRAFVPGLEASLAWKQLDVYVEAEYVRDSNEHTDSYVYAWSELGFRPVEWLRVGVAGQRTRTYANDRDLQRGPFVQVTWRAVTVGGYWFNPGSSEQVFVGMLGATF